MKLYVCILKQLTMEKSELFEMLGLGLLGLIGILSIGLLVLV